MRLLLVRHGESVDNVANLYAGSRDSPLTSHGVLQARRLGNHLASRSNAIGPLHRIFSSDLQRALRTAQAIVDAQESETTAGELSDGQKDARKPTVEQRVQVVKVPELRERHFGSLEGKKVSEARGEKGSVDDLESRQSMRTRATRFVDKHLVAVFQKCEDGPGKQNLIVIVSHGIYLNVLLAVLLERFPLAKPLPDGQSKDSFRWSNTGFVEAAVEPITTTSADNPRNVSKAGEYLMPLRDSQLDFQLRILATNVVTHLDGLKKTRGGVGSARFDATQRTIDSFFGPPAKKAKMS